MIAGDLVRFKDWEVHPMHKNDCGVWEWRTGLLIEYQSWEKVATILHLGKIIRIRAGDVQIVTRGNKK